MTRISDSRTTEKTGRPMARPVRPRPRTAGRARWSVGRCARRYRVLDGTPNTPHPSRGLRTEREPEYTHAVESCPRWCRTARPQTCGWGKPRRSRRGGCHVAVSYCWLSLRDTICYPGVAKSVTCVQPTVSGAAAGAGERTVIRARFRMALPDDIWVSDVSTAYPDATLRLLIRSVVTIYR